MCTSDSDCSDHGTCDKSTCQCDLGYMGPKCQLIQDYLGKPYLIFFYFICVLNIIVLCLALWKVYQFVRSWLRRKHLGIRHISITILTLGVLVRTIHFLLMVDQDWTRAPQSTFFFIYPCLLVAYACELVLWYPNFFLRMILIFRFELYTNTTLQNIERLPKYRTVLLVLNIFIFPVEFGVRIPSEILKTGPIVILLFVIWMIYMMIIVLVELVAFLFIGFKLVQKVRRMQAITGQEAQKQAFLKLTRTMITLTVSMLTALIILVCFFLVHKPQVWFALFILCRLVEYVVILLLLYIVKPPSIPEADTSAIELSEGATKKTLSLTLTRSGTGTLDEKDNSASS